MITSVETTDRFPGVRLADDVEQYNGRGILSFKEVTATGEP